MDDSWYVVKENVEPLVKGRSINKLEAAVTRKPSSDHAAMREKFEDKILVDDGDDPLKNWVDFIVWIEQTYPDGGKEGRLHEVVKDCVRRFLDDERYAEDPRFLGVILRYSKQLSDPLEMFTTLSEKRLFQKCAQFYVDWSWYLELAGNNKSADNVIERGILIGAEPKDDLVTAQKQLQMRIVKKIASGDINMEESEEERRKALAGLKFKSKKDVSLAPVERVANTVTVTQQGLKSSTSLGSHKKPNATPKIYVESENKNDENMVHIAAASKAAVVEDGKENEQKPGKWSSNRLKQKPVVKPKNDFTIYEEDAEDFSLNEKSLQEDVLRVRKRNENSPPVAKFETLGPNQKFFCDLDKLYVAGTEYSFEEVRYKKWLNAQRRQEEKRKYNEAINNLLTRINRMEEREQERLQEKAENQMLKSELEDLKEQIAFLRQYQTQSVEKKETQELAVQVLEDSIRKLEIGSQEDDHESKTLPRSSITHFSDLLSQTKSSSKVLDNTKPLQASTQGDTESLKSSVESTEPSSQLKNEEQTKQETLSKSRSVHEPHIMSIDCPVRRTINFEVRKDSPEKTFNISGFLIQLEDESTKPSIFERTPRAQTEIDGSMQASIKSKDSSIKGVNENQATFVKFINYRASDYAGEQENEAKLISIISDSQPKTSPPSSQPRTFNDENAEPVPEPEFIKPENETQYNHEVQSLARNLWNGSTVCETQDDIDDSAVKISPKKPLGAHFEIYCDKTFDMTNKGMKSLIDLNATAIEEEKQATDPQRARKDENDENIIPKAQKSAYEISQPPCDENDGNFIPKAQKSTSEISQPLSGGNNGNVNQEAQKSAFQNSQTRSNGNDGEEEKMQDGASTVNADSFKPSLKEVQSSVTDEKDPDGIENGKDSTLVAPSENPEDMIAVEHAKANNLVPVDMEIEKSGTNEGKQETLSKSDVEETRRKSQITTNLRNLTKLSTIAENSREYKSSSSSSNPSSAGAMSQCNSPPNMPPPMPLPPTRQSRISFPPRSDLDLGDLSIDTMIHRGSMNFRVSEAFTMMIPNSEDECIPKSCSTPDSKQFFRQ